MTAIKTLHILNKSPDHPRAAKCLEMVSEEDGLLLIGGGVLFLAAAKLPNAGKLRGFQRDGRSFLAGTTGNQLVDHGQ